MSLLAYLHYTTNEALHRKAYLPKIYFRTFRIAQQKYSRHATVRYTKFLYVNDAYNFD